jgi:hypothetical protein
MTYITRLNLDEINKSLLTVERNWKSIDDKLDSLNIGRKDTIFNSVIRQRMMSAFEYLDSHLVEGVRPFSQASFSCMVELNNCVHFGHDNQLRLEYHKAIQATTEKFYNHIDVLTSWYKKHEKDDDSPLKIAAEIYVGIVGYPQLFIEGNHRTGSLISNWINLYHGYPPFVLSEDNAIAYFAPSSEIKHFVDKSTWRGKFKLPKYKKSFRIFWEDNINSRYIIKN